MNQIFPMIQGLTAPERQILPLYRDCAFDFAAGVPVFQNGSPVIVEGKEAVKVWAFKALMTPRTRHEIYSWDYGSECEELIGQGYSEDVKQAEAQRYVTECLLTNPYITAVEDVEVSFAGGELSVSARLETVYGKEELRV